MAEYVRMPKAHYEAACNTIRAKTGKAAPIKSGEMATEIEGITGGGGSSADVRYVTFMSYDGSVEYCKIPVAVGYDCPNPKIDTPTKESTVQYSYTFYGWATTPNGGADANWNKAITEDKIVYANFTAVVRYYTVTYYDGSTVLKTESLAYGSTPAYEPNPKSGYSFDGWQPTLEMVTGDMSYYAQWIEKVTFASSTWEDIARVCEEGKASSTFTVGDSRTIKIKHTDGAWYDVQFTIIGINHDTMENGGTASISVLSRTSLNLYRIDGNTNNVCNKIDGWSGSQHRSLLNSKISAIFPADLVGYIKPVIKKSACAGSPTTLEETTDRIWIPSITEYGIYYGYTASNQGSSYSPFWSADGRKAYRQTYGTIETSYTTHATRSAYSNNTSTPVVVKADGTSADYNGIYYARVGFCI